MNFKILNKENLIYNSIFKVVIVIAISIMAYAYYENSKVCHCKDYTKGAKLVFKKENPLDIDTWICCNCGKEIRYVINTDCIDKDGKIFKTT